MTLEKTLFERKLQTLHTQKKTNTDRAYCLSFLLFFLFFFLSSSLFFLSFFSFLSFLLGLPFFLFSFLPISFLSFFFLSLKHIAHSSLLFHTQNANPFLFFILGFYNQELACMSVHAQACRKGDHRVLADNGMGNREDDLSVCWLEFAVGWWAFWHAVGHEEQVGCMKWSTGAIAREGAGHACELTRTQLVIASKAWR